MKKILSTATKAAALALAASTFSFAGPGLADGAAKFVGNITQSNTAPGANDQFTQLWNQATAENGCKWGSVEGSRGNFNWGGCDAAYNWAKNNGGHFKFHALVWGSQYPNWLPNLSVDETKKAITAWFDAVQKRYPDLEMIDVVNEAIRGGNGGYHSGYNNTKIVQALGGDNNGDYAFITTAFKMARERWPDAILIYNDYNTIQWDVDGGINLVNTIKKNGAPIDGYGLQAHDLMTNGGNGGGTGGGGNCMNYNTFKSTMEKIHSKTNKSIARRTISPSLFLNTMSRVPMMVFRNSASVNSLPTGWKIRMWRESPSGVIFMAGHGWIVMERQVVVPASSRTARTVPL